MQAVFAAARRAAFLRIAALGTVLAAAACAPLPPEELAARRQAFDANLQCERVATARSGVLANEVGDHDDDGFLASNMAADFMWENVYDDCMRSRGFDPYQFYH